MHKNFKVVLEYDGSRYHGWQRQPNATTIQQEVEHAIATITRQTVTLIGSGRTDAGVHAYGQVANFQCATRIGPDEMMRALNSLLPNDIVVRKCCLVVRDFHARYAAKSKRYRYHILNQTLRPAIGRNHCWWIRAPLDTQAMQTAAVCLIGEHDYKGFEGSGSPRSHTVRTVMEATVKRKAEDAVHFTIQADGFLRYMVRNIIGSLVAVGHHKMGVDAFQEILLSRDRSRAAATAPPQGLFLLEVFY